MCYCMKKWPHGDLSPDLIIFPIRFFSKKLRFFQCCFQDVSSLTLLAQSIFHQFAISLTTKTPQLITAVHKNELFPWIMKLACVFLVKAQSHKACIFIHLWPFKFLTRSEVVVTSQVHIYRHAVACQFYMCKL